MKIRLDEWIAREFDPPPAVRTARQWIKDRKIYPPPQKIGRAYYVDDKAVYRDAVEKRRLVDRVFENGG
ncbi:excisionase [Paraburkholderia tropica]|uniref:excisionase n=1 Tax=Paraburkholderia tropica TaxID=92647 RepID=UPI002AB6065A|nr:excisionase [Paraburkholderia tropica]